MKRIKERNIFVIIILGLIIKRAKEERIIMRIIIRLIYDDDIKLIYMFKVTFNGYLMSKEK